MPARTWKELAALGDKGGRAIAAKVRAAVRALERTHPGDLQGVYLTLGDSRESDAPCVTAEATEAFAPPNPRAYDAYLRGKKRWRTTPQAFWSTRSLDPGATVRTRLVVPPVSPATYANCGDVLSFSRLPLNAQAPLWQAVAAEAARLSRPGVRVKVWTHGREVAWLHVRIRVTQLKNARMH